MAFGKQKRIVPKPELIGPHQSATPMYVTEPGKWSAFRQQVITATVICLLVAGAGWLTYGPLFHITTVTVSGTRLITPKSVKTVTEQYLDRSRLLVLPNRTMWVLSVSGLQKDLETAIRKRLSIEGVTITKQAPHTINVVVAERTPVATWSNGTTFGSIDRQGVIIDMRATAVERLPLIVDASSALFTVDASVVKHEVMTAVQDLAGYLQTVNVPIQNFIIPVPTCPEPVPVVTNTNIANTNSSIVNTNMNATNTNVSILNLNTNVTTTPETPPCDVAALKFSSDEIRVQVEKGPIAYFDRHGDLQQAVQTLHRVMAMPNENYKIIDVRFAGRAYVQ